MGRLGKTGDKGFHWWVLGFHTCWAFASRCLKEILERWVNTEMPQSFFLSVTGIAALIYLPLDRHVMRSRGWERNMTQGRLDLSTCKVLHHGISRRKFSILRNPWLRESSPVNMSSNLVQMSGYDWACCENMQKQRGVVNVTQICKNGPFRMNCRHWTKCFKMSSLQIHFQFGKQSEITKG
jgi:hypothetical protein